MDNTAILRILTYCVIKDFHASVKLLTHVTVKTRDALQIYHNFSLLFTTFVVIVNNIMDPKAEAICTIGPVFACATVVVNQDIK
jgi:hypothetical protein